MASPVDVSIDSALRQTVDRRYWTLQMTSLALAIGSGLAGALGESHGTFLDTGTPAAFALSLALYTASPFISVSGQAPPAGDLADPVRRVRLASRQTYLILYGLFAAKELQFIVRAPGAGAAPAQAMHALWPYLAGALVSLALARGLALRGAQAGASRPA